VAVWLLASLAVCAQQAVDRAALTHLSTDLAVTYNAERSQLVPSQCCFWMQGGGVDADFTFWKGFGLAGSFNSRHASAVAPGVDVNELVLAAGPRYTFTTNAGRSGTEDRPRWQIFTQGLFGGVHAFNGVFPGRGGAVSSAGSFALQAGGGVNLLFRRNFGLRLFEVNYARTTLPNSAGNAQNDLRLGFGLAWRVEKR
jgi:hypothetical protein